jgi:hypothetical protein
MTTAKKVQQQVREALENVYEGENTEAAVDITGVVICDTCNTDLSNSEKQGGFILGSWGVCPDCEPRMRENLKKEGEEHAISAECPKGMSHKDWILSLRPPGAAITIRRGKKEKPTG